MTTGPWTAIRRILLLVNTSSGPFPLSHIVLAVLKDHLLLDHVRRLREARTLMIILVRVRTPVIAALELEVRIGRPRIWGPSARVEAQPHLVFVLVLFGHLLQSLRSGTQLRFREVHVRVRHSAFIGVVHVLLLLLLVAIEDLWGVVLALVLHERAVRGLDAVDRGQLLDLEAVVGLVLEVEVEVGVVGDVGDEVLK